MIILISLPNVRPTLLEVASLVPQNSLCDQGLGVEDERGTYGRFANDRSIN